MEYAERRFLVFCCSVEVVILKTKTQTKEGSEEAAGNAKADHPVNKAALGQTPMQGLTLTVKQPLSMDIVISLQKEACSQEHEKW